jgi:hypothetical protein
MSGDRVASSPPRPLRAPGRRQGRVRAAAGPMPFNLGDPAMVAFAHLVGDPDPDRVIVRFGDDLALAPAEDEAIETDPDDARALVGPRNTAAPTKTSRMRARFCRRCQRMFPESLPRVLLRKICLIAAKTGGFASLDRVVLSKVPMVELYQSISPLTSLSGAQRAGRGCCHTQRRLYQFCPPGRAGCRPDRQGYRHRL